MWSSGRGGGLWLGCVCGEGGWGWKDNVGMEVGEEVWGNGEGGGMDNNLVGRHLWSLGMGR